MINTANALKLLGDETRLRILRLVAREPLNVSELTSILGLAQSGISRHLGLLRKAMLVEERREGVWTYYQIPAQLKVAKPGQPPEEGEGTNTDEATDPDLQYVWAFVQERLRVSEDPYDDLARLTEVLRMRENFGGGLSDKLLEPGQSWFAWSRALHFLLPKMDALDLGCGDGTITVELSRFGGRVVGIDTNPHAIAAAHRRAEREGVKNVSFREDRIETLREKEASFDLAIFSQSLHHVEDVQGALSQAVRVLRPGGRMICVDLAPHEQQWVVAKLGHLHMGFEPDTLAAYLKEAGLEKVTWQEVHQRRGEVFRVILVSGLKPA